MNNQQFIIERWTPENSSGITSVKIHYWKLRQRLQMLFPPPHMDPEKNLQVILIYVK